MEEKVYKLSDIKQNFTEIPVGAIVDEEIVNELKNSVPPLVNNNDIMVNGECYSHYLINNAKHVPCYLTYIKTRKGNWIYCGALHEGIFKQKEFISEFLSLGFAWVSEPLFGFFNKFVTDVNSRSQINISISPEGSQIIFERWQKTKEGIMHLNTNVEMVQTPSNVKEINNAITYYNDNYECNFKHFEYVR